MELMVTNFPFFTYIEIKGKSVEDFIRVNRTEATFTYRGKDYKINQTTREFISELESLSVEHFDFIIEGILNNVTLR